MQSFRQLLLLLQVLLLFHQLLFKDYVLQSYTVELLVLLVLLVLIRLNLLFVYFFAIPAVFRVLRYCPLEVFKVRLHLVALLLVEVQLILQILGHLIIALLRLLHAHPHLKYICQRIIILISVHLDVNTRRFSYTFFLMYFYYFFLQNFILILELITLISYRINAATQLLLEFVHFLQRLLLLLLLPLLLQPFLLLIADLLLLFLLLVLLLQLRLLLGRLLLLLLLGNLGSLFARSPRLTQVF